MCKTKCIALVMLLSMLLQVSCSITLTQSELEKRFGPLKPYKPKVHFVHFITKDHRYQIDCINA